MLCLGAIAGAHGVRGQVRVKTFTATPDGVGAYGALSTEDGRRFRLVVERVMDGFVIARIDGVGDRNAAEALRGTRLYVPRAALPQAEDDEFYHADLLGLAVEDRAGTVLGTVRAIHDFGAGDLLELALPEGGTALLPFTQAVVPVVDVKAGRLVAEPPEGWNAPARADEAEGPQGDMEGTP
ncbi:ribosome maturation factor RimM [Zavarzinia sp. CC-PAN008]|uniref:ribosome maturation factor RimM n=1 Tax=Zavarzinia sp. CC-PAN008 TaxID=3243332 RepID=UPI003F749A4B